MAFAEEVDDDEAEEATGAEPSPDAADVAAETSGDAAAPEGGEVEASKESELDKGKSHYNKGNYAEALRSWGCSMKSVNYILEKGLYKNKPEQLQEVFDMELKLSVNMAQAYLKTGEWNKAIESGDKALSRDPKNVKALYRKASALKALLRFEEVFQVLDRLLEIEPENAAAKAMLAEVRRSSAEGERREKEMSRRIFAGLAAAGGGAGAGEGGNSPEALRTASTELLQWFQALPRLCHSLLVAAAEEAKRLLGNCGRRAPDRQGGAAAARKKRE